MGDIVQRCLKSTNEKIIMIKPAKLLIATVLCFNQVSGFSNNFSPSRLLTNDQMRQPSIEYKRTFGRFDPTSELPLEAFGGNKRSSAKNRKTGFLDHLIPF